MSVEQIEVEMKREIGNIKREQIIRFIEKYSKEKGYAPSVREIMAAVGLKSTSSVYEHMRILKEQGRIEAGEIENAPRSIRVIKTDREIAVEALHNFLNHNCALGELSTHKCGDCVFLDDYGECLINDFIAKNK